MLGITSVDSIRSATKWTAEFPLIRLHIGLEDVDDLIADLAQGFEHFNKKLLES